MRDWCSASGTKEVGVGAVWKISIVRVFPWNGGVGGIRLVWNGEVLLFLELALNLGVEKLLRVRSSCSTHLDFSADDSRSLTFSQMVTASIVCRNGNNGIELWMVLLSAGRVPGRIPSSERGASDFKADPTKQKQMEAGMMMGSVLFKVDYSIVYFNPKAWTDRPDLPER